MRLVAWIHLPDCTVRDRQGSWVTGDARAIHFQFVRHGSKVPSTLNWRTFCVTSPDVSCVFRRSESLGLLFFGHCFAQSAPSTTRAHGARDSKARYSERNMSDITAERKSSALSDVIAPTAQLRNHHAAVADMDLALLKGRGFYE